jgi:hypothetical protein
MSYNTTAMSVTITSIGLKIACNFNFSRFVAAMMKYASQPAFQIYNMNMQNQENPSRHFIVSIKDLDISSLAVSIKAISLFIQRYF